MPEDEQQLRRIILMWNEEVMSGMELQEKAMAVVWPRMWLQGDKHTKAKNARKTKTGEGRDCSWHFKVVQTFWMIIL